MATKQVLVVEDDGNLLQLMERWLTAAGHAVIACQSFETAKKHLVQAPPEVLLADVRLGAYNGLQLVILAKEQRPEIVAIAMSAFDDPMLRREAALCGALYLVKPFTSQELLTSVATAVSVPPATAGS